MSLEDSNPANFSEYNPQDSTEYIFHGFDQILRDFLGNDPLKEEIWTINQQLLSVYLEICDENDNSTTAASFMEDNQAKIVKCTFMDFATIHYLVFSERASEKKNFWPIQPLKLLIPGNYPDQSPLVLDKLSILVRDGDMKNEKDLTGKAISKLKLRLESFKQPLSLEIITKAWGDIAHEVVLEYTQELWDARYGIWWGKCAPAC